MTAGWHYGGLIGANPIQTSGNNLLRTSGVLRPAAPITVEGSMSDARLVGTSPETTTRGYSVQWAGAPNGSTLDGSQVMLELNGTDLYVSTLSTPFDMSTTGTWTTVTRPTGIALSGYDRVCVSGDGNWAYYPADSDLKIYQVALSQPWNFSGLASSATYTAGPYTSGTNWVPSTFGFSDITFSQDGTMLYVTDNANNNTYQWQLSTPWLVNSMTFVRKYVNADYSLSSVLGGSPTMPRPPRSANLTGTKWFGSARDSSGSVYLVEGTASTAYNWATITWNGATKFDATSSLVQAPADFDVGPSQQIAAISDVSSTHYKTSFEIPDFASRRALWGRQIGLSPHTGTALRSTGIISTPEAYQLKL
jgi:hypothetical protein